MAELLLIDTETGGLDPALFSILSLGGVVWRDGKIVDTFSADIAEAEIKVHSEAMAVNRIDLGQLRREGRSPADTVSRFKAFLVQNFPALEGGERITLAGHNAAFDIAFLKRLYRIADKEDEFERTFWHRCLDTASVAGFLMLAELLCVPNVSSDVLFKHFGICVPVDRRHTALGDALATAELLNAMMTLVRNLALR